MLEGWPVVSGLITCFSQGGERAQEIPQYIPWKTRRGEERCLCHEYVNESM